MNLILFISKNVKFTFAVTVIVAAIVFREAIESLYEKFGDVSQKSKGRFTEAELTSYDGVNDEKLYLAILGIIFDVTNGKKHYAKGASYNYFVGKDASRAFVTGNFNDEGPNKDHVMDLSCDDLFSLLNWKNTFQKRYKYVGLLIGRYYDKRGKATPYQKELNSKIQHCQEERDLKREEEHKYPPCNAEWDVDKGTRVWCTKSSGGISRAWTGVPRQLYSPGDDKPHCVCVNVQEIDTSGALLKAYDDCPLTSTSCNVLSTYLL